MLDGAEHDGSILEVYSAPGMSPARIISRASTFEEVWINDVYLFKLVGRLSSTISREALL